MRRLLFKRVLFPYWRMTRGLTFGVQAMITREGSEVLLVRHGYRPGWHFPGGGVEWQETMLTALTREVEEETGVVIHGEPQLHGIFANFQTAPCDHIAFYRIEHWEQPRVPEPSWEIKEQRFFPLSDLPEDMSHGAKRRVEEICHGKAVSQHW